MIRDIRFALRLLRRNPAFTAIAIATLALGMGVNTVAFTFFNAFVLRPLPVREPEALVRVNALDRNGRTRLFSIADYRDIRDGSAPFAGVVALAPLPVSLGDAVVGRAATDYDIIPAGYEFAFGLTVSGNYFQVLGGQPTRGRLLTPDDDRKPGMHAVVVLSERFWRTRFGGDTALVGRTVRFNGRQYEVVGIAAEAFVGTQPNVPDFWVPLAMRGQLHGDRDDRLYTARGSGSVALYARLKPHVLPAQAASGLTALASRLGDQESQTARISLTDASTFVDLQEFMPLVVPLSLAVGLVLVIACANVANLLLARAVGRRRETQIRLALGSSHRRLVQQLITESAVLGALGGIAGLAASHVAIRVGYPLVLSRVPLPSGYKDGFTVDLHPDWRVFTFAFAVSLVAAVLFGLAPALNSARARLTAVRSRFRDALVVAQVGIGLALLVGTVLLLRSMWFVEAMNPGFQTARLYSTSPGLLRQSDPLLDRRAAEQLLARLADFPGIESLSTVHKLPLSGMSPQRDLRSVGVRVSYNHVGPQYFRTVGIALLRGRDFTQEEMRIDAPVAIVSEGAALRLWPGDMALGKFIQFADDVPRQVVGVVSNARVGLLWRPEDHYVYLPIGSRPAYVIFRAPSWSASTAESTLQIAAAGIHPELKAPVRAIDASLEQTYAPFRFLAAAAGLIAGLTLLLASVGLYGVVSLMVRQRAHEIAIRMALGAMARDVMRTVLGSSLRLVAVGVAIGLCGALVFAKLLAVALIGIKPFDLVAFASTSAVMATIAVLATWMPARRAARVDPMVTFRQE